MMAFAANSKRLAVLLCAMFLAALLCLLLPMSASADVRITLVDEDHQPITGSLDINTLEGKKFIICCKGSDKAIKGVYTNLYDQNGKRLNGSIKTYASTMPLTVGHFDFWVTFEPSALKSGERYTFKLEYREDNFSGTVESSQLTIRIGDGTDADDPGKDDSQGDESQDDGKDDSSDKKPEEPDSSSGKNGHGKTDGSASGGKHGASSAVKRASSADNNASKLDGASKGSQGGGDDGVQSASGLKAGDVDAAKSQSGDEGSGASGDKTVLASLGSVYSLSDASSSVIADSGVDSDVIALDVTGTPWLFIALATIMCLALPAGLGSRFFRDKYKLGARSRLGSGVQDANDAERQGK